MRKEFGKWLMDIAKYITTAVILTSIFGEIDQKWVIYVGGIISILLTLGIGLWLVRDKKEKGKWYGSTDYVWFCVAYCYCWRHLFLFGRQERCSCSLACTFVTFMPGNFKLSGLFFILPIHFTRIFLLSSSRFTRVVGIFRLYPVC